MFWFTDLVLFVVTPAGVAWLNVEAREWPGC
jgi:hypothetical protein